MPYPLNPGWPVEIQRGTLELRPLRMRDLSAWREVRLRNEGWLAKWEPTSPVSWADRHSRSSFITMRGQVNQAAKQGIAIPLVISVEGNLAGQVTVAPIVRGALRSGDIGYWIDERYAGRGVIPLAVALVVQHCFGPAELHRVQAAVRPENEASRRVMTKLGFREEAYFQRYLDIDYAWRDHIGYALTAEDQPEGLLRILADG